MSTSWRSSYDTCVSISDSSPQGMLASLQRALKVSRYAELRLDSLAPEDIPGALEGCERYLKRCVCTVRPESEGGYFAGTESERYDLLRMAARLRPYRLDVEYSTMKKRGPLDADILISWHDFNGTPEISYLEDMMRKMAEISPHVKIVTMARQVVDPSRVLSLYGAAEGIELLAFCMGMTGKISRLICLYLGAPYTYVYLDEAVAPGQYSLDEIRKLIDLRPIPGSEFRRVSAAECSP